MKRMISVILAIAMMLAIFGVPVNAAQSNEASPRYIETKGANTYLSINDTGKVTISINCTGKTDVTKISVTTYLEYRIGSAWYRALVNPWSFTQNGSCLVQSFSGQISTSGTFRARSVFTVTGSTVETITVTSAYIEH